MVAGRKQCSPCPAGSFCPPTSDLGPQPCKPGFVCPESTMHEHQHPCPAGTFNPTPQRKNQAEGCQNCTEGSYCARPGLSKVSGPCHDGYVCSGAAVSPEQERCPKGSYCPAGKKQPCEKGTFDSYGGLTKKEECQPCPRGHVCADPGAQQPGPKCDAGTFCDWRSVKAVPCLEGHFCEKGTEKPQPCPEGTFRKTTGAASSSDCSFCSPGTFCLGSGRKTDGEKCPARYFCPRGTKANPQLCPIGLVCRQGLGAPEQCKEGFTSHQGAAKCKPCLPGFECFFPTNPGQPGIRPCPPGKYCEANKKPQNCSEGTIRPLPGARKASDCQPCTGGWFCTGQGRTAPTDVCDEGFFCLLGATQARPDGKSGVAGPCPPGHYCGRRTKVPKPCASGTYQPDPGQSRCL